MTFHRNRWIAVVALLVLGCFAILCFPKAPKHDDWALFHSTQLRSVKCRALENGQLQFQTSGEEYEIPIKHWATIESLVLPARKSDWKFPKQDHEGLLQIVLERKTGEKMELEFAEHGLVTTFWHDGVLYKHDLNNRFHNSFPIPNEMVDSASTVTRFLCIHLTAFEGGLDDREKAQERKDLGLLLEFCTSSPVPWKKGYIGE